MRKLTAILGCAMVAATTAVAMAQQPGASLAPRNLVLQWVADEHNEVTVPANPTKPITVTLNPTILYTITPFQCSNLVSPRIVVLRGTPVIELVAKAAGTCHVAIETSRRSYLLDLTIKNSTPLQPIAPVASISWAIN